MSHIKKRRAFTLIELVFIIVVLGILASIAIPKFSATRDDAHISSARATIGAVRSGIVSVRQKYLLRGVNSYINSLSCGGSGVLFDGNCTAGTEILMYPLTPSTANGHWSQSGSDYVFHIMDKSCTFAYNSATGTFALKASQPSECDPLDF